MNNSTQNQLDDTYRLLDSLGTQLENTVIAYSAGKDSLVVAHILATMYGIRKAICDCSFWFDTHLEDAKVIARQLKLDVVYMDRFGDDYVITHPNWLFPSIKDHGKFYGARQQTTAKGWARRQHMANVAYGRRTEENSVPASFYRTSEGLNQLHPIRNWKTEHVWDYLKSKDVIIPRIYTDIIGMTEGSTPWNFMVQSRYAKPIPVVIRNFCPSTYGRLNAMGILNPIIP